MSILDVDAVRAFVTISELKSFTRAAEALGTSQGTLSVKVRRLEDRLGQRLLERTPRMVRLSSQGEMFIEPARDFLAAHERALSNLTLHRRHFKLGIACHVMGPEVPVLLGRLKELDPTITMEVKLDSSRLLLDTFMDGKLDAVIIRSDEDRRDGTVLCPEPIGWFASANHEYRKGRPIRLVHLSPHCSVSNLAAQVLTDAGIPWIEAFSGGGVSAVIAAISAGLGIAAFPRRLASPEFQDVGEKFGLPPLPSSSIVLHSSLTDARSKETLRAIASAFR